jgi:hypothetical protein
MKNIRIENVGDINFDFPYLEVFFKDHTNPFLEIGVSEKKQLSFKFYVSVTEVSIGIEEWEYIISVAKDFLPRTIKNENDFLGFTDQS